LNSLFRRLNESDAVAVAPSILSADFSRLGEEIRAVERAGADFLHIDIMDGHFVPNLTFGPMIVEAIAKLANIPLITHLMIDAPGDYAEKYIEAGSSLVSFHWEVGGCDHEGIVKRIRELGCGAGIAINPGTPLSEVDHLLSEIDLLLTMTVFPGFGGQAFIPDVLDKIQEADRIKRERGFEYVIEVDGGIKPSNAAGIREAGGRILVAGSAVFGSGDYGEVIRSIRG